MKKLCSVIILLSFFVCACQGNGNDKKSKQDIVKAKVSEEKEKSVTDEDLRKTQKWLKGLGKNYSIDELKKIKKIYLVGTAVTDADLVHLKPLKNLKALELIYTRITDDALHHLKTLKNLANLNLKRTRVTIKGVKELKKHFKICEIFFDESINIITEIQKASKVKYGNKVLKKNESMKLAQLFSNLEKTEHEFYIKPDFVLYIYGAKTIEYAIFLNKQLIYKGHYLDAWEERMRGNSSLCYKFDKQTKNFFLQLGNK